MNAKVANGNYVSKQEEGIATMSSEEVEYLFSFSIWIKEWFLFRNRQRQSFIPDLSPWVPIIRHSLRESSTRRPLHLRHFYRISLRHSNLLIVITFPVPRWMPSDKIFKDSILISCFESRHVCIQVREKKFTVRICEMPSRISMGSWISNNFQKTNKSARRELRRKELPQAWQMTVNYRMLEYPFQVEQRSSAMKCTM